MLAELFSNKSLVLEQWTLIRKENPYRHEGTLVLGLEKQVYERQIGNEMVSAGAHYFNGKLAFIAWGPKEELLCKYHAIAEADGRLSPVINSCPEFSLLSGLFSAPGFSLQAFGRTYTWRNGNSAGSSFFNSVRKYKPLIVIFAIILAVVWAHQLFLPAFSWHQAMLDFMAGFFLIFGALKLVTLPKFVDTYATYDLIAARSRIYAYLYPFIELALGLFYLGNFFPLYRDILTVAFMAIGSLGVLLALRRGEEIQCACIGTFFKLPLSKVTLVEDLLMGAMAAFMLAVPFHHF